LVNQLVSEKQRKQPMTINYKKFIQDNFLVLDSKTQLPAPYRFNVVQQKYYDLLWKDYPKMEGVRDIVLKARQEGISTFILALFTVDFIMVPHSVSICISHRKDSTELLFKKVKFFLESYCKKNGFSLSDYLKTDNKGSIENKFNNAAFYIGTAGAKVGGRGGSARNIHFSECAFYQDTELITASEIVVATAQQVPQDRGMIFIESTANGEGNYYQKEWERANEFDENMKRLSSYHPRFFGWQEFYSKEWVEQKRGDFPTEALWKQEYPQDADEAFIVSGSPYFDVQMLQSMLKAANKPIKEGRFAADGQWI